MSTNRGPIAIDMEALSEDAAFDETVSGIDDNDDENQSELTHSEYDALEEAVMQTPRGRTFLREHARRNRAVASDLVMRALEDYQTHLQRHEMKQPTEILAAELQNMSDAIKHTRRDIAAIKPKDGANNRIMAATEDLDAIVTATERATNDILAAAEHIQEICEKMRETGSSEEQLNAMEEHITNIFLACSFQDITGQRTTKVVNALRYLEQRVGAMIEIWGSEALRNGSESEFGSVMTDDEHPEAGLLNGPQLEGHGVDQDDIDELLSGDAEQLLAKMEEARQEEEIEAADEAVDIGMDIDDVSLEVADFDMPADETPAIEEEAVAPAADGTSDVVAEADENIDYANLSEEADADTIDAIFNS